eukprot:TRINITY_DN6843_c0_g1_i2.p1 TRINITY_DN6843_c0_g1~~TRINITY_DN6843_c0_g1_i2.p1  ORF type:complete len:214 (+),score=32.07 TRINITY_DN6843_c0_g1_i2:46-687(+)
MQKYNLSSKSQPVQGMVPAWDIVLVENADFRVRNTFIEWMPAPEVEMKRMKRCPTWDGVLSRAAPGATSPSMGMMPLDMHYHDEQHTWQDDSDVDKTSPGQEFIQSRHQQRSRRPVAAVHEEEHMHKQPTSRPCKKIRLMCHKIIERVIELYQHDQASMSKVAWKLASENGYMRGLCVKHKIPMQAGKDLLNFELPQPFRCLSADACTRLDRS